MAPAGMTLRSLVPALGVFLLAGAGCRPVPVVDDDDATTADPGDDDAGDDDSSGSDRATVTGRVVDTDGQPIAALDVTLCNAVCQVRPTDADGFFYFDDMIPGAAVLENAEYPGVDQAAAVVEWTRFFDLVPIEPGADVVIEDPVVLERVVSPTGPLTGPQALDLDGGLHVEFDADRFGTLGNPLPMPAEAVHFGAVEIPESQWPTGGLQGWTILRAWGTAVWDLAYPDGFAVRAPLDLPDPLPADTEVAFLIADYVHGFVYGRFFLEDAELDADGRTVRTPVDGGLDRSTLWLAVARFEDR